MIRLGLAGAAAWIGYLSVLQSLAVALPASQIERAYALAPGNGRIAARLSEVLSGPEATPEDRARAARVARAALQHEPTAVGAVATLGLDALIRGDEAEAKRLFSYSQHLSRRDLRTQLWAIEDAVASGEISSALKHYDIALRTKRTAPELLYPVLSAAIANQEVRAGLVTTLAAKPIWGDSFVYYAAANSSEPGNTAGLFKGLRRAGYPIPDRANNALVNALRADNAFEEAWSYYSAIREGADRRRSRDPDFKAMLETPLAFDWVAENSAGISTALQPRPDGGLFDFAVSPSVSGRLLWQQQMLPEGEYVLEGHSVGIDQPSGSRPYWTLSCLGGRELGRLQLRNSSEAEGRFSGRFTVPANCPVQVLALIARSSSEIDGVAGQIDRAQIRPLR
ncbi:hypothetical protein GCM10011494_07850 [Novosphingobium endophyticum]|uniref:Tetratricopeptide repeat protein n=1 Tax=Novosphingobium endophyticum TaxID=1955250 RepID=A0A916TQ56_9SPHN|nr:hypothetical protein GCM10011494_07850 [Novosphingobium endophyticum]